VGTPDYEGRDVAQLTDAPGTLVVRQRPHPPIEKPNPRLQARQVGPSIGHHLVWDECLCNKQITEYSLQMLYCQVVPLHGTIAQAIPESGGLENPCHVALVRTVTSSRAVTGM
jgi:hypothetical protein